MEDLIGKVFARLTVFEHDGTRGKNSYLKCQCSCGAVKSVRRDALLSGDVKSCGCVAKEIAAAGKARRAQKRLERQRNRPLAKGSKCEHGRERTVCKDCAAAGTGGGSICEHGRQRNSCSICNPHQTFQRYRRGAAARGLSFSLTEDQFREILKKPCTYCGENHEPRGIDRRDGRIGYVLSNCQSCCWPCNQLKSRARNPGQPEDEYAFLRLALKIAKYQENKKLNTMQQTIKHIVVLESSPQIAA